MPRITNEEFKERINKTQTSMKEKGIDLLFCFSSESEPQYVRYYSDYAPLFETAGCLIPYEGEPALLVGPESETFSAEYSRIENIKKILYFRESSDPEYPDAQLDTFDEVIEEMMKGKKLKKVGIVGLSIITHVVYSELLSAIERLGDVEVVSADALVNDLKKIKSVNEIACLQKAYDIAEYALEKVVNSIHIGMTENQVRGIALNAIFEKGAESEGYPFWILTGKGSNKPIGKVSNKVIEKGDIVQVQISARYEGYVSTIGRPMVAGKATDKQRDFINASIAVEDAMLAIAKPGVNAKELSDVHFNTLRELGYEDSILYGPSHGTGLMENEYPWIESSSDYLLNEDMAFTTCLYLGNDEEQVGIRMENGYIITADGAKMLSDKYRGIIEFN